MMANPEQEVHRVLLAQAGDRQALDELFKVMQEPLYRYICGLMGNAHLAEDILQEVFILIYRKLRWLREPELFRAWAYRIATRETFKRLKRERKWSEQIRDEGVLETIPELPVFESFPPELIAQLPQLLAKISPASHAVIALHYLQEMTIEETAEVLGIAVGTVKSRLSYGLASLRQQLQKDS
jgi:RNA polymerase sigma-70 factor (ECF subfamily)